MATGMGQTMATGMGKHMHEHKS